MTNPHGHLWRDTWTVSGPLSERRRHLLLALLLLVRLIQRLPKVDGAISQLPKVDGARSQSPKEDGAISQLNSGQSHTSVGNWNFRAEEAHSPERPAPPPFHPPDIRAGSNRLFQVLDLYWRWPEPGDLRYKSGQLKMRFDPTLGAVVHGMHPERKPQPSTPTEQPPLHYSPRFLGEICSKRSAHAARQL